MIRRTAAAAALALGLVGVSATTTSASELPAPTVTTTAASPPLCLYLMPIDFGWCIRNPVHDLPVRP